MNARRLITLLILGGAALLAACEAAPAQLQATPTVEATVPPTNTPLPPTSTPTATPAPKRVSMQNVLPETVRASIEAVVAQQPADFVAATDPNTADIQVAYAPNVDLPTIGNLVFALVAPLPTLVDDVPVSAFQAAWQGQPVECEACTFTGALRLTDSTLAALKVVLGEPAPGAVEVVAADQLVQTLWDNADS